jgi:hypothetical protein
MLQASMLEQDLMQIDFFPLAQVVESLDIYMCIDYLW